jgi:tetratricopeptide (TPR) repeat protein
MTSRLVLLFVLFTSILAACAEQDDPKIAARSELNAGVQAFRQAHYEEAVSHFEHATTLNPELTVAHLYLATAYAQMFVPGVDTPENVVWATKAVNEYSEVLQRNPSSVVSLQGIAYLEIQLKNFDRAKESYKKAIAVDPNDPELFYAAGVADWSMAYRAIAAEKAKLDADSEHALFLSDNCAEARTASLENVDDGLAMLTKAIALRENYDDAMVYMNLLYRLRADLECGSEEAHAADIKKANEWTDMATAARKKKADAASKSDQGSATDAPPR